MAAAAVTVVPITTTTPSTVSDHFPSHSPDSQQFPGRTNFALVGSSGVLLRVTAPTHEEAEFYRMRLREYRWTLSVSCKKHHQFMEFALESLDNAIALDEQFVPAKPGIEELMGANASSSAAAAGQQHEQQYAGQLNNAAVGGQGEGGLAPGMSYFGLASPVTSSDDDEDYDGEDEDEEEDGD